MHGQLRDPGSSFYPGSTANLDVIHNRFQHQRVEKSNDPSDAEQRLRALVVMKRIRVEEFFLDFDKLRKGTVTRPQFESTLSRLGLTLTPDELASIFTKYATPQGQFNYVDFCAAVNSAFTTYGIQKDPLAQVAPVEETTIARKKYLDIEESEAAQLEAILAEYRRAVEIKRIHLKPMFQDFDVTQCQHVSKHQFLRVLGLLGVSASPAVLNTLAKAYMDKGNVDEVNYLDFCNDVDSP
jgi:Ca2+-binding EF-hand superfamily protein